MATEYKNTGPIYLTQAQYDALGTKEVGREYKIIDGEHIDPSAIAPAYDSEKTYEVGNYVQYDGSIYKCTTAITTKENWTSEHWSKIDSVTEVINELALQIEVCKSVTTEASNVNATLDEDTRTFEVTDRKGDKTSITLPSAEESGKIDDVQVDGVSVVTDKVANIDLSGKVDKVDGKGLSTNDYTDADKAEVAKVASKQDKLSHYTEDESGNYISDDAGNIVGILGNDALIGNLTKGNAIGTSDGGVQVITGKTFTYNDNEVATKADLTASNIAYDDETDTKSVIEQISLNCTTCQSNIGDMTKLETDANTDLVSAVNEVDNVTDILQTEIDDADYSVPNYESLPLMMGQPMILFGAGTPQESVVPINWNQYDPETDTGYNWNGLPSALGQVYINTSASSNGRYTAVPTGTDNVVLAWKNF